MKTAKDLSSSQQGHWGGIENPVSLAEKKIFPAASANHWVSLFEAGKIKVLNFDTLRSTYLLARLFLTGNGI